MAKSVNSAFDFFMINKVNLDPDRVTRARASRDWLISKLNEFESDPNFPHLYSNANLHFGSFARKVKIRPLDDIDLMIGIHAEGATYHELPDKILMYVHNQNSRLKQFCNEGTIILNSRKVINSFLFKLNNVPQYSNAEIKRNLEAATLKLSSYDWNFDIAPCFLTAEDRYGKTYYLIPDGNGNWKKTDPRVDQERLTSINQSHEGYILNLIRIIKYWNRRSTMPSIQSYLLENLILDKYSNISDPTSQYIDVEIPKILSYIASAVYNPVDDPKGIQGNLNNIPFDDRLKISQRANFDYNRALEARSFEDKGDMQTAIKIWKGIFGNEYPDYG